MSWYPHIEDVYRKARKVLEFLPAYRQQNSSVLVYSSCPIHLKHEVPVWSPNDILKQCQLTLKYAQTIELRPQQALQYI